MIQGYGAQRQQDKFHVSFPFADQNPRDAEAHFWQNHPVVKRVHKELDLQNCCGFITMVNLSLEQNQEMPAPRSRGSSYLSTSPINGIKGIF
jgi:hypothetical protein